MFLNSKFSNFRLDFPKGWIYPDIAERYQIFFDRLPIPYRDATDYINFTIQSVSWPSIEIDTPEQTSSKTRKSTFINNDNIPTPPQRTYKSGFDLQLSASKEFTVIFRTTEGFLNYWIMCEQLEEYIKYGTDTSTWLPPIHLHILDHYGYLMMSRIYQNVVFKSISELEMSYSSNVPEYRTFSCDFIHNGFILKKELQ